MNVLERYNAALDAKAAEYLAKADTARLKDDERGCSVCLMQASMLGDMLKQLGRVDHEMMRPGLLQKQIDAFEESAKKKKDAGDLDNAEREQIKADTVRFALNELRRLEAENG